MVGGGRESSFHMIIPSGNSLGNLFLGGTILAMLLQTGCWYSDSLKVSRKGSQSNIPN